MAEMQILQDITYTRLIGKAKEYKKQERIDNVFFGFSIGWAFVWIPAILVSIGPWILEQNISNDRLWGLLEIVLLYVMSAIPTCLYLKIGNRKPRKANLEDDEWVRFCSGSIVVDLEEFNKRTDAEKKEESRKNALKNAYDLLSIADSWSIGNFLPVKLLVGDSVNSFSKNLKTRIIPALRGTDNEEIEKVNRIMYQLYVETQRRFSIEVIENINSKISHEFPKEKQFKIGFSAKISVYFRTHNIQRHGVVFLALFFGCAVFYYVFSNYLNVPNGYVLTASVAAFIGLLAIYVKGRPTQKWSSA